MKNRPQYAIDSVDHALLLAQLLLLEGPMRVSDAARHLGVSASTAHRLLAMLVYRNFAEQDTDRRYRSGPVFRTTSASDLPLSDVRAAAIPHLQHLVERTRESANLVVLTGSEARFVHTVQCDQVLRVGDRAGKSLPAHTSSAGKAMLSLLGEKELEAALAGLDEEARVPVRRGLHAVRRNGFALNHGQTERGLSAIGVATDLGGGRVVGVSLAMPSARYRREHVDSWVEALHACARAIAGSAPEEVSSSDAASPGSA